MRAGRGRLGLLAAAVALLSAAQVPTPAEQGDAKLPHDNGRRSGHPGSKIKPDSTPASRARHRWEKKRKRNSRRGKYTTKGPRL